MRKALAAAALLVAVAAGLAWWSLRAPRHDAPAARLSLRDAFDATGCAYPPREVCLVAFKDARRLEVWVRGDGPRWRLLRDLPILAASGTSGPKRREGDGQVPEGVYRLTALNPRSRFHLSIRVDYPDDLDRREAAAEGRTNLGGDIYIHGGAASIGCLAMGDAAIEELYTLVSDAGLSRCRIAIAPTDLRRLPASAWPGERYDRIRAALADKPAPASPAPPPAH